MASGPWAAPLCRLRTEPLSRRFGKSAWSSEVKLTHTSPKRQRRDRRSRRWRFGLVWFLRRRLLPAQAAQVEGRAVPLHGELLADQPIAAVVPQIHRRRPAGDAEVVTALRLAAERQLLHADILQVAVDLLAGVRVDQRHRLVVVVAGQQFPVRGRPGVGPGRPLLTVGADAQAVALRGDLQLQALAVVAGVALQLLQAAVFPAFRTLVDVSVGAEQVLDAHARLSG